MCTQFCDTCRRIQQQIFRSCKACFTETFGTPDMHGVKHLKHTNHKHEVKGLQNVIHYKQLHMIHNRDGNQAFKAGTRGGMGSVSSLISGAKTAPDLDSSAKPLILDKSTSEPAAKTLVSSCVHPFSHEHRVTRYMYAAGIA